MIDPSEWNLGVDDPIVLTILKRKLESKEADGSSPTIKLYRGSRYLGELYNVLKAGGTPVGTSAPRRPVPGFYCLNYTSVSNHWQNTELCSAGECSRFKVTRIPEGLAVVVP